MRRLSAILTVLYPELSITTTMLALGSAMLLETIEKQELKSDEIFVLEIRQNDIQIKKILKPNKYPRYGFKEIRRLDKLVGVRLYLRAVKWLIKLLKYF